MGVRLIQCGGPVEWTDAEGVLHSSFHGDAVDLSEAEEERLDGLEIVLAPPGATAADVQTTAEQARAEALAHNTGHGPPPIQRGHKSWD